ncbi:MAG: hypothetical protein ACYTEL_16460 [Planctomycetota bacterium]
MVRIGREKEELDSKWLAVPRLSQMKFYLKNSDENKKKAVRGLEGLMEG